MPIYRFGDFEIDSRSGELRRQGSRVRLRPQPAAVLQYLVERPGELVSRQEIQELLWPDGTFVQFDDGLNSCIKQIRAALRDDRARPRYVETLSRRGYRFIAPVEAADEGERPLHLRVAVVPFQGLTSDQAAREVLAHTWAEMFDAELGDILRAQAALAAATVDGVLLVPGHHRPEKGHGSIKSTTLIATTSE